MSKYKIQSTFNFEKWEKQNQAEIIDGIDGVLLDSLLYSTKNGTAAFMETYETTNSSVYTLIFSRGEDSTAEDIFYKRQAEQLDY